MASSTKQKSSKFAERGYVHASGDVKFGPDQRGCNVLPDGSVAVTAKLIELTAAASADTRGEA
jgi:hypothetical protein